MEAQEGYNPLKNSKMIHHFIDHTLLKADATEEAIAQWCGEAKQYHFFSVCFNSGYIALAHHFLKGSDVRICSVAGFPLGAMSARAKLFEAECAVKDGADEIDMVINIGELKSGKNQKVLEEIATLKKMLGKRMLKVIIETCYLTNEEKKLACQLAVEGGADFVKTSTGFGTGGATVEDILLMKAAVNGQAQLKASGGIRDRETAQKYIDLGVTRIGTSNGVAIINSLPPFVGY